MQRLTLIACSLLLLPVGIVAQESPAPRAMVNASFGGGAAIAEGEKTGILSAGGGAEFRIYKGLMAGVELGYVYPPEGFRDGFGLLSTNGTYHFSTSSLSQRLVPFVTGGYSLGFRNGTSHMVNFGGGMDYWFHDHVALRLEVREHIAPRQSGDPTVHFPLIRIGVVGR